MPHLDSFLQEFETQIPQWNIKNPEVSTADTGWHIAHSVLVLNMVLDGLIASNPEKFKPSFNVLRTMVFLTKKIPRGRGKAPEMAIPKTYSRESLTSGIFEARKKLKRAAGLHPNCYIQHPLFGMLNLKQTLNFLSIHTMHHLKIIRDILKKPSAA